MDDAGVNGRAAQAHQHQPRQRHIPAHGQQHGRRTQADDGTAHADEALVVKFQGQEAVQGPATGDAQEEHAGEEGRRLGGHALVDAEIGAGPQGRRLLQGAVTEKRDHDLLRAGNFDHLGQGDRLGGLLPRLGSPVLPQPQSQEQHRRQDDLQNAHDPVAAGPMTAAGEHPAHDVGTHGRAHAPHAVQPAHMAAGIVEGHIVVQTGIHAACAQAIGDGPQQKHPVAPAGGEAEQGGGSHGHGEGRDLTGAEAVGQPVAEQAGDDGAEGDDHGHRTGVGDAHPKLGIHGGPCRAQKAVGQPQGDEGQIDDGK